MIKKKRNEWKKVRYGNMDVSYSSSLNGGGMTYGQDFIPIIEKLFGKVSRACEICSGPGFIGFSLLANGLCDSLSLIDVNKDAIRACRKTIKENGLGNRVKIYHSDLFDKVPKSEKWDLVVGNPPHFNNFLRKKEDLIGMDPDWDTHRRLYKSLNSRLTKNGHSLLVENFSGSKPELWEEMIEDSGLIHEKTIFCNPTLVEKVKRAFFELTVQNGFSLNKYISFFISRKPLKKSKEWIFSKPYQFYFVLSSLRK